MFHFDYSQVSSPIVVFEPALSMSSSTVIVTGAGGGLGKAIATAFLAAGANVAICDVHQGRLSATEQEWASAGYKADRFLTTTTDVTNVTSVQKLIDDTAAKFGRLDVLVNNAGILDDFSPVGECSPESEWFSIGVGSPL